MTSAPRSPSIPDVGKTPSSGPVAAGPPWIGIVVLLVAAAFVVPYDGPITAWWSGLDLPGDVDQELRFLQQFGQIGSLALVAILVCALDRPAIRRTLLDLGMAILVTVGVGLLLKSGFGRVRPAFGGPDEFLGPWWMRSDDEITWSQRASFPSSHTAAAAVLGTWIWIVVPRIRWLAVALVAIVAASRVRFGSHWPSDVLFGAALGAACSGLAIGRLWGTRLLDVVWRTFVDRTASPAWPEVAEAVRSRHEPTPEDPG